MSQSPVPDPALVRAARQHLTSRYATGVDAVLWEMHKHPIYDLDAVARVVEGDAHADGDAQAGTAAMDVGAALLVLMAARLDVDRLEAALLDRALELGMDYEQIAMVLELPNGDAAARRHQKMIARAQHPTAAAPPPVTGEAAQLKARVQAARRRAKESAGRARQAEQRRRQLRREEARRRSAGAEHSAGVQPSAEKASPVELAAQRAAQAKRLSVQAFLSAARAHEVAAERHETAFQLGIGDAAEHRRQAEQHRRAAASDRAAARRLSEDL